jgi:uncharacterized membrane protein (UPF0127 family)
VIRYGLPAIAALLAACAPDPAPGAPAPQATQLGVPQSGLREVMLTIRSAGGVHRFTVEVAETAEQQQHGMMFRTSIGPDEGMIFPYDPPQNVGFWMKNTLIPLDMVFIRADGTIARIATAVPHSLEPVPAGEPVAAVLEIAGGRAAELGIREGDRVEW